MASYTYTEGLSECQLSPLQQVKQTPHIPSKLEILKNEYQERALQQKEQKMLKLLTQQQERVSQRINGHRAMYLAEERAWASNWTVTKRTVGVDRAHPLKPVHPRHDPKLHRSPSANTEGIKHSQPYVRSKSGPSRTVQWQELERNEMDLEAEIRRKEALLREKLRRTEEELRRIQKEKEEAEREEIRATESHDARSRPRRTKLGEGDQRDNRKDNSLSIDKEGSVKSGLLSIDIYSQGSVKARKHSAPFMDQSSQQYGGARNMVHPVLQSSSLKHVVDSFNQMSLTAPAVQASGHPSSEHLDHGNISHSQEQQLVPCQLCGRHFMESRLQKHQAVCEKLHGSKRKVFDSSKARAKGTDLEQYLHQKGRQLSPVPQVRTNSWRQKHEAFLRTILHTRVVQDDIGRAGRISNLPPRPPEKNPDYMACPHCSRRFAPGAAERHIPKCKTIKSKPRPPPVHHPRHRYKVSFVHRRIS